MKLVIYTLFLAFAIGSAAQTLPPGFARVTVGSTISTPTVMAFAPDGRIFVAQQTGALRVIKNNGLLPTPFVTITVNSTGERGLLGLAFDPDFQVNKFVYVYYTVPAAGTTPPYNRISRFTANGDVAVSGSEQIILNLDPLSSATNHNGGALAFGLDGKLYVAIGDNALGSNAQNLNTYHGKILRINKDGSAPTDNPFYSSTVSEQRKRVWAYGVRNPYTFSIQPVTGRLLVNDVGQNAVEEINDATQGGKNFGWPTAEGPSTNTAFTNPIYYYYHSGAAPVGCAITGGSFFNPMFTTYPASYVGQYFFMDYCSNWIYALNLSGTPMATLFASNIGSSSLSLLTGPDGNLYYLSRGAQSLYKITSSNSVMPTIAQQPVSITVPEGDDALLSITATGTAPLVYQWYKDNNPVNGAVGSNLTFSKAKLTDSGVYQVKVTNIAGEVLSNSVIVTVEANAKPTVAIDLPLENTTYTAGTTLKFSGHAQDKEDGNLPASSLKWTINFHHDQHIHDQPSIDGVAEGSLVIPDQGETSPHVFYRIVLFATDSKGAVGADTIDVLPRTSHFTIDSEPPGLQVLLDGQLFTAPITTESVAGMKREIGAIDSQTLKGQDYLFSHWGHGGDADQLITIAATDVTYKAFFNLVLGAKETRIATLFPVPADDWLIVRLDGSADIQLTDMLAKKWDLPNRPQADGISLDVREVPAGVYVLSITTKDRTSFQRVLIQR